MMRQFRVVRKPARCGLTRKMIEPGGVVTCPDEHWYKILKDAGVLGDEVKAVETATIKPDVQKAIVEPVKTPKSREEYEVMTKNELVRLLNIKGIENNKRQLKSELIDLLMGRR